MRKRSTESRGGSTSDALRDTPLPLKTLLLLTNVDREGNPFFSQALSHGHTFVKALALPAKCVACHQTIWTTISNCCCCKSCGSYVHRECCNLEGIQACPSAQQAAFVAHAESTLGVRRVQLPGDSSVAAAGGWDREQYEDEPSFVRSDDDNGDDGDGDDAESAAGAATAAAAAAAVEAPPESTLVRQSDEQAERRKRQLKTLGGLTVAGGVVGGALAGPLGVYMGMKLGVVVGAGEAMGTNLWRKLQQQEKEGGEVAILPARSLAADTTREKDVWDEVYERVMEGKLRKEKEGRKEDDDDDDEEEEVQGEEEDDHPQDQEGDLDAVLRQEGVTELSKELMAEFFKRHGPGPAAEKPPEELEEGYVGLEAGLDLEPCLPPPPSPSAASGGVEADASSSKGAAAAAAGEKRGDSWVDVQENDNPLHDAARCCQVLLREVRQRYKCQDSEQEQLVIQQQQQRQQQAGGTGGAGGFLASRMAVEEAMFSREDGRLYKCVYSHLVRKNADRDRKLLCCDLKLLCGDLGDEEDDKKSESKSSEAVYAALQSMVEGRTAWGKLQCLVNALEHTVAGLEAEAAAQTRQIRSEGQEEGEEGQQQQQGANTSADALLVQLCRHLKCFAQRGLQEGGQGEEREKTEVSLHAEAALIAAFVGGEECVGLKGREGYAQITFEACLHIMLLQAESVVLLTP